MDRATDKDVRDGSQLVLEWNSQQSLLNATDGDRLSVGTSDTCSLLVDGKFTSAQHLLIERREHDFLLIDTSTNGTFIQTEDEQVSFVHRGEMRLWGSGYLSLGEPLTQANAVRFVHL